MKKEDLRSGDVLLTRSNYLRGKAIRLLDGVPINHAAIYEGDGKIIEALAAGLVRQSFKKSLGPNEYVEVFRHENADRLDMSRILQIGAEYVEQGGRFALEQIILLAVLISSKPIKHVPALGPLIFFTLRKAASISSALAERNVRSMICSEFVFRCFNEVKGPSGSDFRLYPSHSHGAIVAFGQPGLHLPRDYESPSLAKAFRDSQLLFSETEQFQPEEDTQIDFEQALEEYISQSNSDEFISSDIFASAKELQSHLTSYKNFMSTIEDDGEAMTSATSFSSSAKMFTNPNWVTPGDLFRSPTLKYVGRLLPKHYNYFEEDYEVA